VSTPEERVAELAGRVAGLEARVAGLADRQAVLDALQAYSHAIDRGEEAAFLDCFTPDATFEVRSPLPGYPAAMHAGRVALADFIAAHSKPPAVHHKHLYVVPDIAVEGDRATAIAYFVHLVDREHRPATVSYGRYLDVLIRCEDGRWRILERVAEVQASEGSAAISFEEPPPDPLSGA
jgi:ketosteroid isomerase-like protein